MRKLLGGVVLALGVGGLGFYANNNNAKRMQTRIAGEAAVVAMSAIHDVNTTVAGRDIRVSGIANSDTERDTLIAALDAIKGRRVVVDDLVVLEKVSPFVFQSHKTADGQTYAGLVPSEAVRKTFAQELKGAEAGLELKAGVPDDQWDDVVLQALSAMAWLKEGDMSLTDRALVLTGKAATPPEKSSAEALLAELPEGYSAEVNIGSILPLAAPFKLSSIKTGDVQTYKGVVQNQAGRQTLRPYLGGAADTLKQAYGAPDAAWESVAGQGLAALALLEDGEMTLKDQSLTLTGLAANPPTKEAAEKLVATLPDGYSATVNVNSLLETVSPFTIGSVKTAQTQAYAGVIPDTDARTQLAAYMGAENAKNLKLAYGAPDEHWVRVAAQGLAALGPLDDGKMSLADRVLTVEGRGATPIEKAQAEALVAELPDGYTAKVNIIAILQISSPYTLRSIKSGALQTIAGDIPSEEDRLVLAKHTKGSLDGLQLSAGAPDDAWTGVAAKSLEALSELEEGKLEISDRAISLTGIAKSPTERDAALAALSALPVGYSAETDLKMLDDGSPAAYEISYDPVSGASVSGKLPKGMSPKSIASALGLSRVTGTPTIGLIGNTDAAVALSKNLNVMADWLPDLETFSLSSDGKQTRVTSEVMAGVDAAQVKGAMAKGMGKAAEISVRGSEKSIDAGVVRETVLGDKQIFSGGFWLPVQAPFKASVESCLNASDGILSDSKINFVTGSATLDAKSVRTVNSIASVMMQCLDNTGLNVEIGGHTDSSGSHAFNVKLSQSRAQTVVDELIARGIPADLITAKGFGPDVPIASNDTDEGKAENRRTTIRWFIPVKEAAPQTTQSSTDAESASTTQVSE